MFSFYLFFLKSLFTSKGNIGQSKKSLLEQHVFSLPGSAVNDRLIGLKQFKRTLDRLWKKREKESQKKNSSICAYAFQKNEFKQRAQYITLNTKQEVNYLVAKASLLSDTTFFEKLIYSFISFLLCLVIFPLCMVSRKRLNYALLFEVLIEGSQLARKLKAEKCKTLYYFYSHEPEANLLGLFLMNRNIEVIKVPVISPLFMFNKTMVASKVVLSLKYQFEEANEYWKEYDFEIEKWRPEGLDQFINKRFSEKEEKPKICYYSHGSWIRQREDHNLPWINEVKMELDILELFKKNKDSFGGFDLTVCLHPKEKGTDELFEASKLYYQDIFGSSIQFGDPKKSSYQLFEEFDLGVGSLSTVLFQRIYCGYKTLMINDSLDVFPLPNVRFNEFVLTKFDLLKEKMESASEQTPESFFKGTEHYTHQFNQKKT